MGECLRIFSTRYSKMRLLFLLGGIIFLFLGDISSGQKYFPVSPWDYGRQGDNDYGSQGDNDYGLSNTDSDYGRQGDNDYGSQGDDDYVRIIYDDYERQGGNDYGLSYTESDYGSQGDDDYARRNRKCRKTDTKRNCLNLMIHQCTQRCEKNRFNQGVKESASIFRFVRFCFKKKAYN